jgi:hypothetical protein
MPIWIVFPVLCIASIVAVPAGLRVYSGLVRRLYAEGSAARSASLNWVRGAERFWFRVSPFVLIGAAAVAAFFGLRAQ